MANSDSEAMNADEAPSGLPQTREGVQLHPVTDRFEQRGVRAQMGEREEQALTVTSILYATALLAAAPDAAHGITIIAKTDPGGRIFPSGQIVVASGAAQQFKVLPDSGYSIHSVTGCGGKLSGDVYTTVRVTADCTVKASFTLPVPRLSWFRINNDAAESTRRSVVLNHGMPAGSMPTSYRASEFPDFPAASWRTYTTTPAFELSSGAGLKTVYLQLWSPAGMSNVMSDTINFQPPQLYSISARDFYSAATLAGLRASATAAPYQICASWRIVEGPADNVQASEIAARSSVAPSWCEFSFFDNGTLKNGFVFKQLYAMGFPIRDGCAVSVQPPAAGSTNISFRVELRVGRDVECQGVITTIVLEGPANGNWRNALGLK